MPLAAPVLAAGGLEPDGEGELDAELESTFSMAMPPTPVPFLHTSSERSCAVLLKRMSAHCGCLRQQSRLLVFMNILGIGQARVYERTKQTYIIQRTPTMPQLDNLDTSLQSLDARITRARVPGGLETSVEIRLARLLEAEDARARLVEELDEADVEVCRVGAQGEVDGCEGVLVRAVDDQGAAR